MKCWSTCDTLTLSRFCMYLLISESACSNAMRAPSCMTKSWASETGGGGGTGVPGMGVPGCWDVAIVDGVSWVNKVEDMLDPIGVDPGCGVVCVVAPCSAWDCMMPPPAGFITPYMATDDLRWLWDVVWVLYVARTRTGRLLVYFIPSSIQNKEKS